MLDIFEVVEVSEISTNQWLVKGRAWQEIKVGDTIYSAVGRSYRTIHEGDSVYGVPVEAENALEHFPFTVTAISTYGREIDFLGKGLTGNLVLKGKNGTALRETTLLVIM